MLLFSWKGRIAIDLPAEIASEGVFELARSPNLSWSDNRQFLPLARNYSKNWIYCLSSPSRCTC